MSEELFQKLIKDIQDKYYKGEITLDELIEESFNLGAIRTVLSDERSKKSFLKLIKDLNIIDLNY